MIRLLYFLPSEKVLTEIKDSNASLISIIEGIGIEIDPKEQLAKDAGIPFRWTITALWHRTAECPQDEGVKFECKADLYSPNGEPVMGGTWDFLVTNSKFNYRTSLEFQVFPVGTPGVYTLKLLYRRADEDRWLPASEYPILVSHKAPGTIAKRS